MDDDKDVRRVQMFDGTNFPTWRYRMEVVLEEHDLLDFLTKEAQERDELVVKPEDNAQEKDRKEKELEKAKKRERKCRSLIVDRIADSQIEFLHEHKTPKAIWDAISGVHDRKSVAKRMHLG